MSAWRLYSRAGPGRFHVTLAHGSAEQTPTQAFASNVYIRRYGKSFIDQIRWMQAGRSWLRANAGQFDVMHALTGFQGSAAMAVEAARLGLPSVVKLAAHRDDLADKPGWRGRLGIYSRRRAALRRVNAIICISDAIFQECRGYGFPESMLARIPNGVDTIQFRPPVDDADRRASRVALGWRDLPTLLWAGAIIDRKRPDLLIEASAVLHRRGVEHQVVFVGPDKRPEYSKQMKARAADLGIEPLIHFHGFTTDMATCYRAADVFCLPSSSEGLANAVLEAMATGLPPVVTPISGMTDLVTDGQTGRLVRPEPADIADACGPLLSDAALRARVGQAALQVVLSRYAAEVVLDQHESLFRRIMNGLPASG
jgi:glycosyltransferase involved in cell wall biosynthesis